MSGPRTAVGMFFTARHHLGGRPLGLTDFGDLAWRPDAQLTEVERGIVAWRTLAAVDLRPDQARFVVLKNPMNYRQYLAGQARVAFVLDTPGPTPPTLRHVAYRRLQRPWFPATGRSRTCSPPCSEAIDDKRRT